MTQTWMIEIECYGSSESAVVFFATRAFIRNRTGQNRPYLGPGIVEEGRCLVRDAMPAGCRRLGPSPFDDKSHRRVRFPPAHWLGIV